jgi:Holliday junction resolvase RusA-like endonuclease
MASKMRIVIPGDPIATARHRCRCLGKRPSAYDPQFDLKKMLRLELSGILQSLLYHGKIKQSELDEFCGTAKPALKLTLRLEMPINKSDPPAIRNLKLWGIILPNVKPDYDNLAKHPGDIGNGLLWHDDSQIVEAHIYEKYSENPCTIIEVEAIKMYMTDDADLLTRIFSPLALEKLESDLSLLLLELESHRLSLISHEDTAGHKDAIAKRLKEFSNAYGLALKKMKDGK